MAWTRRYDAAASLCFFCWLGLCCVCSRREAEGLIAQGLVSIDGEKVTDPGRKILPGQTLVLSDGAKDRLDAQLTVVLHKPVNYVSAQPEPGQIPAARLLTRDALVGDAPSIPGADTSLAPLGRLDMDSRGLLLLSEDGVLAKAVIGPESELEKEYRVLVTGEVTKKKLKLLHHDQKHKEQKHKPTRVSEIGDHQLRFVLKEGRNRQFRRMCDLV